MERHPITVVKGKVVSTEFSRSASAQIPNCLAFIVLDQDSKRTSFRIDCPRDQEQSLAFIAPKFKGEQFYYEAGCYKQPKSARGPQSYAFVRVESGPFAGCQIDKGSNL